ncbi:MAG: lipo-like protein [Dehalococcoidia bacterium]|nr:lipo-like protein [Dehalococcoidia bacterium]
MRLRLRSHALDFATRLLTKPLGRYQRHAVNDGENLRRHIRKGDVILVEGDQRVSEVIKYLTQSSWSHAAIYVGDELWRRNPALRHTLRNEFGDDAQHLIVEALVECGVVASPLTKYLGFNIRVCRPYDLHRDDLRTILDDVIAQIGYRYDVKNLVDLARYFLPVSLVPRRLRRRVLSFGSGLPTQVICSSMIAHAFDKVRYPILPEVTPADGPDPRRRGFPWTWRRSAPVTGLFRTAPITLTTPRDFDISPYFEIVKFNFLEGMRFDYRQIRWAE